MGLLKLGGKSAEDHGIGYVKVWRASRISVLTKTDNSLNCCRCPPFQAFRDTVSRPSGVTGPVDCSHGRQRLICSACRWRRSVVQPLAMVFL